VLPAQAIERNPHYRPQLASLQAAKREAATSAKIAANQVAL
jgi:hypothetical protein